MVRFDGDMASIDVMTESFKTKHDTKHFTRNVALIAFSFFLNSYMHTQLVVHVVVVSRQFPFYSSVW